MIRKKDLVERLNKIELLVNITRAELDAHKSFMASHGFIYQDNRNLLEAKAYPASTYTHTNSKGVTYYLNVKDVTLRGGKVIPIYYFSKDLRPEATQLPDGFTVLENPRNGFLTVRRPESEQTQDEQ